jgi:hypothetical protein
VDKLKHQQQRAENKLATLEHRVSKARTVKLISSATLAITSGIAMVVFPPMMLILPVALPLAILVTEIYEQKSSKKLRGKTVYLVLDHAH